MELIDDFKAEIREHKIMFSVSVVIFLITLTLFIMLIFKVTGE